MYFKLEISCINLGIEEYFSIKFNFQFLIWGFKIYCFTYWNTF